MIYIENRQAPLGLAILLLAACGILSIARLISTCIVKVTASV